MGVFMHLHWLTKSTRMANSTLKECYQGMVHLIWLDIIWFLLRLDTQSCIIWPLHKAENYSIKIVSRILIRQNVMMSYLVYDQNSSMSIHTIYMTIVFMMVIHLIGMWIWRFLQKRQYLNIPQKQELNLFLVSVSNNWTVILTGMMWNELWMYQLLSNTIYV